MCKKVRPTVAVLVIVLAVMAAVVACARALNRPPLIAQNVTVERTKRVRDQGNRGVRGRPGGPARAGGRVGGGAPGQ